jgi:hypothetical protein
MMMMGGDGIFTNLLLLLTPPYIWNGIRKKMTDRHRNIF